MRLPAFDALYEKSRTVPHSPTRTAIFNEMNDLIFNYAPWIMSNYPYESVVAQPWLKGYNAQNNAVTGTGTGPNTLAFYASRYWIDQNLKTSLGH